MRIEEKKGIILEIEEDVKIPGTNIILEKGDKIEVFEAAKVKESDDEDDSDDEKDDDDDEEMDEKKKKEKKA